jgi:hypothetical protein
MDVQVKSGMLKHLWFEKYCISPINYYWRLGWRFLASKNIVHTPLPKTKNNVKVRKHCCGSGSGSRSMKSYQNQQINLVSYLSKRIYTFVIIGVFLDLLKVQYFLCKLWSTVPTTRIRIRIHGSLLVWLPGSGSILRKKAKKLNPDPQCKQLTKLTSKPGFLPFKRLLYLRRFVFWPWPTLSIFFM